MKSVSIKDVYFLLVILFSGMASAFSRSQEALILLWLLGFFVFYKTSRKINKNLSIALLVWGSYFLINTVLIRSFHPFFFGTYFAKIMIAYWLISHYKTHILKKYEDVIYSLTILSLGFYGVQFVYPYFTYGLLTIFDISGGLFPHKFYSSIGVYTFHQREMLELFPRNAGFTWEPGPFASYIALALFFNIARNGVKMKDPLRIFVFISAIITTQSTTGFLVVLVTLVWYAWAYYESAVFRIVSIPLAIILFIYLFITVPYLQEKIIIDSEQNIADIISHAQDTGKSYAPGRSVGMLLRWQDFKNYPIAGTGGNITLQTGYIGEGNVVAAINGLANILGRYGVIGITIFIFLVIRTGRLLSVIFNYSGWFFFPVSLFIIGFSFGIIESPIIVVLWLLPVFNNKLLPI